MLSKIDFIETTSVSSFNIYFIIYSPILKQWLLIIIIFFFKSALNRLFLHSRKTTIDLHRLCLVVSVVTGCDIFDIFVCGRAWVVAFLCIANIASYASVVCVRKPF